jgi:hypothetical protein
MKAPIAAAIVTALFASASPEAYAADKPKTDKAKESKAAQKPAKSGSLFADTKKYLADNAARTAEIIKKNTSKLSKSVSSDPPPAKGKKAEARKATKASPPKNGKAPG